MRSSKDIVTMPAVMAAIAPAGVDGAPLYHRGQGRKPQQSGAEQARKIAAAAAKRGRRAARNIKQGGKKP